MMHKTFFRYSGAGTFSKTVESTVKRSYHIIFCMTINDLFIYSLPYTCKDLEYEYIIYEIKN